MSIPDRPTDTTGSTPNRQSASVRSPNASVSSPHCDSPPPVAAEHLPKFGFGQLPSAGDGGYVQLVSAGADRLPGDAGSRDAAWPGERGGAQRAGLAHRVALV